MTFLFSMLYISFHIIFYPNLIHPTPSQTISISFIIYIYYIFVILQSIFKFIMTQQIEQHIYQRFQVILKIGKGAYGIVWKVVEKKTKKIFALKKIFNAFQNSTDAQRTYRQIVYLRELNHDHIIHLQEIIRAENNIDIFLLFQFMDLDLNTALNKKLLTQKHKKYIIYQIAAAIKYIHSADLIHRDIKPSNILINTQSKIKICDFGLVRSVNDDDQKNQIYTDYIATRFYRAPQILLGNKHYNKAVDIWSFGCLIAELYKGTPLFQGTSTFNQLQKIVSFTGLPENYKYNRFQLLQQLKQIKKKSFNQFLNIEDQQLKNLLLKILQFNPKDRLTMDEIIQNVYFQGYRDQEKQIISERRIRPKIEDTRKLNLKEYRMLVYKQIINSKNQSQKQKTKSLYNACRKPSTSLKQRYNQIKVQLKKKFEESQNIQQKKKRRIIYTETIQFPEVRLKNSERLNTQLLSQSKDLTNKMKLSSINNHNKVNMNLLNEVRENAIIFSKIYILREETRNNKEIYGEKRRLKNAELLFIYILYIKLIV